MLATTNAFKDLMSRAGIQPVYVVELHLDSDTVRYFSTEYVELTDLTSPIHPNLSDVVGVGSSISIEDRAVSIGEFHLHFADDGLIRDIVTNNFVYGKKVVVKLGCTDFTAYADYLNVVVGVTQDILPQEGEIEIECSDMLALLRNKTVGPRYWLNGHPLEVILDILKASGMAASSYDATTLDWEADTERTHFLTSRYDARRFPFDDAFMSNGVNNAGEDAGKLIDELCALMWGSFAPDETGIFKFAIYDPTNSVVRNLAKDDIGAVQQLTAADPLYNSISFNVAEASRKAGDTLSHMGHALWGEEFTRDVTIGFTKKDLVSAAEHNFLGNDSSENDLVISTSWFGGPAGISYGVKSDGGVLKMDTNIARQSHLGGISGVEQRISLLADTDGMVLRDTAYNGYCGNKFNMSAIPAGSRQPTSGRNPQISGNQQVFPWLFTNQANRGLSASNPAYLLIEGLAWKFVPLAVVKTQTTIGDTVIELENTNNVLISGTFVVFGTDAGPIGFGSTVGVGYRVAYYDGVANTVTIVPGCLTTIPVGAPVYEICGATAAPKQFVQWHTEIVKCIDAYSWGGQSNEANPFQRHRALTGRTGFPGGTNGTLGPEDDTSQPQGAKTRDLAITCIGDLPTAATDGEYVIWPYSKLISTKYPADVFYRFEGNGGALGTSNFNVGGLGTPASGRAQFGTETPYAWRFMTWNGNTDWVPATEGPNDLYHAQVWDITILVDNVGRRLDRFAYGCPRMSIKTPLRHADLQLGDFVTIDTDIYCAYGRSGTDENLVFEIINKTVDALSDDPGCSFELAWVKDSGVVYPTPEYEYVPYVAQKATLTKVDSPVFTVDPDAGTVESVLLLDGKPVTK